MEFTVSKADLVREYGFAGYSPVHAERSNAKRVPTKNLVAIFGCRSNPGNELRAAMVCTKLRPTFPCPPARRRSPWLPRGP